MTKPMNLMNRDVLALVSMGLLLAAGCKENTAPDVAKTAAAVIKAAEVPTGPSDIVYAASNVIRAVDFSTGRVVGQVDIKKAIRQIRFADSGTAYVAASNGLYAVDANRHALIGTGARHALRRRRLSGRCGR